MFSSDSRGVSSVAVRSVSAPLPLDVTGAAEEGGIHGVDGDVRPPFDLAGGTANTNATISRA